MKLVKASVKKFKNYIDSGEVNIEDSVTDFVGKNESGKTTFLKALHYINPHDKNQVNITVKNDYPRWLRVKDKREKGNLEDVPLVKATFSLNQNDIDNLETVLEVKIPINAKLTIEKDYQGKINYWFYSEEEEWLNSFFQMDIFQNNIETLIKEDTIEKVIEKLNEYNNEPISDNTSEENEENSENIDESDEDEDLWELDDIIDKLKIIQNLIRYKNRATSEFKKILPTFFYYDSYSTLPGTINLENLKEKIRIGDLDKYDKTSEALLNIAGVTTADLMEEDFEEMIADLEAAANALSEDILEYWSQNKHNTIKLVMRPHDTNVLDIRLDDSKHNSSTNFSTHSNGFQWFFSFLVSFYEFQDQENVIILLDEPGLSLHGKAQADLLRFIEEKLAKKSQVIYTNHSPFMVNPKKYECIRLVEDHTTIEDKETGVKVHDDVFSVDGDTMFPLQAALGYELSQDLYLGKFNLVVEGKSDLLYLHKISNYFEENKKSRTHLNDKIRIIPVGGADKIPTFVALVGKEFDFSLLVDSDMKNNQKIEDLILKGYLDEKRFNYYGEFLRNEYASVEDLFTPKDYINLFNATYGKNLNPPGKKYKKSIITYINDIEPNFNFMHGKPSRELNDEIIKSLSDTTLNHFEKLFKDINKQFKS